MPSKQYGQTRSIQPKTKAITSARSAYNVAIHKPNVIAENCYFSEKTGCSVIYEDGHEYHIEEIEVAQALADYGIDVRLQPENEAKGGFYIKKIVNDVEKKKFPEGQLNATFWYEQKTIDATATNLDGNVRNALKHAREKNADIAIVYDRYGLIHKENVYNGIELYNGLYSGKNEKRFNSIVVVNSKGEVNFWTH